jgi:transcription elongation factor GreA
MSETKFLTREGYQKLQQELEYLRTEKRAEVADHIRIAKEDGDLRENAGYESAKLEQAFVEGRIQTIEEILKYAQIIEHDGNSDIVALGATVIVQEESYEPETFQIVGSAEANPTAGRISNASPLGRALLGRRVGDVVDVNTPVGVSSFEIIEIK